jgi:hypothetical protein
VRPGIHLSISNRKPLLTGFIENRENQKSQSVFGTKFNFQNFGEKVKTEQFFRFIDRFLTDSLFKIQNLNEKGLSLGFFSLWLGSSNLSLSFFGFCFLFFFQNLNFLNCNRLVFDESKKPVRIGFVGIL